MRNIALISCSKSKLGVPSPAQIMYTSPLFKKSRKWAEHNCDGWYVLSAKYHLLSPLTRIEGYDQTLNEMDKRSKERWAEKVYKQMVTAHILDSRVKLIWLAGSNYKKPLMGFLNGIPQADPLKRLKIGERLQWLNRELARVKNRSKMAMPGDTLGVTTRK